MKRGKDEEKIMGPMFPRLHVNDTEKGGPRAPPRNKMALYEQLSIPSLRVKNNKAPNLEHSSDKGVANEQGMFFSYQFPTRHQSEKFYSQYSNFSIPLSQVELRRKSDEDDLRVPIYVQSLQNQGCGSYANELHGEKLSPSNPSNCNWPLNFPKFKKTGLLESTMRQEGESPKENSKELVTGKSVCCEPRDSPSNSVDRLGMHDTAEPGFHVDSRLVSGENIAAIDKINSSKEAERIDHDLRNHTVPKGNLERGDSVSEASVVDSICGLNITPDDVVGIIGQKRFWKARKAILNQQRVFAIQIFELHRLVKVQRLVAASPQLLVDDSTYLGKLTKASPKTRIPSNCPVKAASKQKSELEKPSQKKESSAENTVGKPSFSSAQNRVLPLSGWPLNGNASISPAPSISSDQNARPLCFNQPQGHQWLIPVMSPTEGLVYKPYTGAGLAGPACTGGRPPGPNPLPCNFLTSAYGIPAPHRQYQLPPPFPLAGPHSYFPTYGMPVMNGATLSGSSAEHMANPPPIPNQASAREADEGLTPGHENRSSPGAMNRLRISKDAGVQASMENSPVKRMQDSRGDAEGAKVLPLFPTAPFSEGPVPCRRRPSPIKAVPHNAISATESAARIFQSIQEERKQYGSV